MASDAGSVITGIALSQVGERDHHDRSLRHQTDVDSLAVVTSSPADGSVGGVGGPESGSIGL